MPHLPPDCDVLRLKMSPTTPFQVPTLVMEGSPSDGGGADELCQQPLPIQGGQSGPSAWDGSDGTPGMDLMASTCQNLECGEMGSTPELVAEDAVSSCDSSSWDILSSKPGMGDGSQWDQGREIVGLRLAALSHPACRVAFPEQWTDDRGDHCEQDPAPGYLSRHTVGARNIWPT